MPPDVARLDLHVRRRSLVGYSLGMAAYTLIVVAMYPAFEHSTSLDKLIKSDATAAALFGVTGSISTSGGWLNANLYANFFPLLMLLMTIGYGAASLAGQDEDGTLCMLTTLPLRRSSIVLQKIGALAVQALVLSAAVAMCVVVGRSFHLDATVADVASISLATTLLGLDFGVLAMVAGAITGHRGSAIGVATVVASASYLISSLAPVVGWIRPARVASLFYWAVGNNQIAAGVSAGDYFVLVGVGLCVIAGAVVAFRTLGVH